jgi:hypothetical protein
MSDLFSEEDMVHVNRVSVSVSVRSDKGNPFGVFFSGYLEGMTDSTDDDISDALGTAFVEALKKS